MRELSAEEGKLSGTVIRCAMHVHTVLGPGLLEKVYRECLYHMLIRENIRVEKEKPLPVIFEDLKIDAGCRLDLLVDGKLILELKTVDKILPVHEAQLYTYLKMSGNPYGLILNFNVKHMRDGIKRMVMTQNNPLRDPASSVLQKEGAL